MNVDPYTPFNSRLDEIIDETPERDAAVAEMMAEVAEERRVEVLLSDAARKQG